MDSNKSVPWLILKLMPIVVVALLVINLCTCIAAPVLDEEPYDPALLENDIIHIPHNQIATRNFPFIHRFLHWADNTVLYQMDSAYNDTEVMIIEEAMREISSKTCVRFAERGFWDFTYVYIDKDSEDCSSLIGRLIGSQTLNLGPKCMKLGIVVHELMHTIGYFHEHNRPDRDEHVDIIWDNIKPEGRSSFSRHWSWFVDTLGLEYDYYSVMHYPHNTFSVDGESSTILPKNGSKEQLMGPRHRLTALDALKVNMMYGCAERNS